VATVESFTVDCDGQPVEGLRAGPRDAPALLFHNGTPTAAMLLPEVVDAAARHGRQVIGFSRPGYAGSQPCRGRDIATNTLITAAVLDAFGAESFVSAGWSGGGPHALADAALLAGRCRAAATIAGVAPYTADGLNFLDGMADDNITEFTLAANGEDALLPFLEQFAGALADIDGASAAEALGDLASDVDKAALTGDFADHMAAAMRAAVSTGVYGWLDDDLAFTKPWGFDVASIARPVAIWQGDQDRMVPFAHGEWLATNVPGAHAHLMPGEGHITLGAKRIGEILDDLETLAR
jgi:pimeloyl-ACP methyl ester carboxylesterase